MAIAPINRFLKSFCLLITFSGELEGEIPTSPTKGAAIEISCDNNIDFVARLNLIFYLDDFSIPLFLGMSGHTVYAEVDILIFIAGPSLANVLLTNFTPAPLVCVVHI